MMGVSESSIGVATGDRELLARFVEMRDERAFSDLVARHGRMVQGTCRRILGDTDEADDAFQATFLVLVARAGELHRGWARHQSIGGWLHRVASNAALQVRRESRSRKRRESTFARLHHGDSGKSPIREVLPILDEEVRRLPDRFRTPLVLCYFEDRSQQEAAEELGISQSTLRRRLDRARELLRGRLVRRGCSIAPALMASMLRDSAAKADALGPDTSGALAAPLSKAKMSSISEGVGLSSRSVRVGRGVLRMMRNQMIRRLAGLPALALLLSSTSFLPRDGLADDGTSAKARPAKVADGKKAETTDLPEGKPLADPAKPKAQVAPTPAPDAPARRTPGKAETPKVSDLDREIIEALKQGPANGREKAEFHGSISVNGQTRQFESAEEFQKFVEGMKARADAEANPGLPKGPEAAPKAQPQAAAPPAANPEEEKIDRQVKAALKKAALANKRRAVRGAAMGLGGFGGAGGAGVLPGMGGAVGNGQFFRFGQGGGLPMRGGFGGMPGRGMPGPGAAGGNGGGALGGGGGSAGGKGGAGGGWGWGWGPGF